MSPIRRDQVTLFGRRGEAATETARDFLQRNEVPLRWIDLDLDPLAAFLSDRDLETAKHPMALFADGARLEAPEDYAEPTPGRLDPARTRTMRRPPGGERNWRAAPAFPHSPATTTTS